MRWYISPVLLIVACSGSPTESGADDSTSGSGGDLGGGGTDGPLSTAGSNGGTTGLATGGGAGIAGGGGTGGSAGKGGSGGAQGGGAGNGGSGGASGSGGLIVACPPGVSSAPIGQWVNITPAGIPQDQCHPNACNSNGAEAFVIDPKNTATLYLSSDHKGLFKTTDCGATWVHIDTGANGALVDSGAAWTMEIDPVDPKIVYLNSGYGANGFWRTIDGGVSFQQMFPPAIQQYVPYGGFIERIARDPTDPLHLLVTFHAGCSGPWAPDCLAESKDRGVSWNLLHFPPGNGEGSGQSLLDSKTWLYIDGAIWRTGDAGANWTKVLNGGAFDSLYHATNGKYYVAGGTGVYESADSISWTLIPNSPHSIHIVGDGTSIFTTMKECDGPGCQPYFSAKESDPTKWTPYPAPPDLIRGGWLLHYDPDHHFLYSSNEFGGFWRVRTK